MLLENRHPLCDIEMVDRFQKFWKAIKELIEKRKGKSCSINAKVEGIVKAANIKMLPKHETDNRLMPQIQKSFFAFAFCVHKCED
jgi:hypothetical protein